MFFHLRPLLRNVWGFVVSEKRQILEKRVIAAAENALYHKGFVSALDIFLGIGWLLSIAEKEWRRGKIPYLEKAVQANLKKISFATKVFRVWARQKNLKPSKTKYMMHATSNVELQFSKNGKHSIEAAYCTHFVSPLLSKKKEEKIDPKLSSPLVNSGENGHPPKAVVKNNKKQVSTPTLKGKK